MAIVSPGERLPATYLERFDPAENVTYRISVLATSAIAVEFHWVDVPSKGIKGTYQCIQGACCQAFGRRSQTYNVPIYVYKNPQLNTEGEIQVWQMTPARWRKFSDLALQVDLTKYDLTLTAQKRGLGMDQSYSVMPDYNFRDYWTPDQKEQLRIAVESFYQMGESSLVNTMNYNDWNQMLYDCGYDLQNMMWPGGQTPMNSGAAFTAIKGAVAAPALPPAPGYAAVAPAIPKPGMVGGVVFQPPAPGFAPVPQAAGTLPSPAAQPSPFSGVVPSHTVAGSGQAPQASVSVGAVPQAGLAAPSHPSVAPVIHGASPMASAVPLGTAPAMPAMASVQPLPPQGFSAPQNEVSGTEEITAEELNKLIS